MSHYHCEIIMPPTADIKAAVTSIMKPFDKSPPDDKNDEDYMPNHSFWDFWVIGGRFAGNKLLARFDKAKIDAFYEWLQAEKVTVSGMQCGKQELSPASQIPKVDAKWNEMFPSAKPIACPLFNHSNDQYDRGYKPSTIDGDICLLADVPATLSCSRVIFAAPSFQLETKSRTGPLEAVYMLCDSQWNGCNHMPVDWDGTFGSAAEKYKAHIKNYADSYRQTVEPKADWIAVTVDYHS